MKNNFNHIAPIYDYLAKLIFGKTLQSAQIHFLSLIPQNAQILILGGGTGQILIHTLQHTSNSHITYQEASIKMIELSKKRLSEHLPQHSKQVHFVHTANLDTLNRESFDVIMTPFVLDLFNQKEVRYIFHQIHQSLKIQGLWLWTDFSVPQNQYKWFAKGLISLMYTFFRIVSNISARELPDIPSYFQIYKYQLIDQASFLKEIIQTQVYCKMNDNM